ncbi:esterase-like activity of phytase family protein [Longispora sp. NPDC051575]|uniref:esterase-like activity of phytase family protein n=1 Tax=Longispora sp. NPDC051575 TaxID=3154943 RepID=UPI003446CA0A
MRRTMTCWWRRVAAAAVLVAALGTAEAGTRPAPAAAEERGALRIARFLGEQRLPHLAQFEGTTVGGFSGMDRDPVTGTWYLLSDDRWRYNPARFYTSRLDIDPVKGTFTGVRLTGVTTLLDSAGAPYPEYGRPGSVDPESIRFDPWSRRLLWAQEGDRPRPGQSAPPLAQQSIRWTSPAGEDRGGLPLPRNLELTETDSGARRNTGIEGLTFTPHTIVAAMEGPRYEDGALPTADDGAPARLTVWDRRSGGVRAQYVYPLDALPAAPIPPTGHADSGVSELLAIDDHRFVALERSWIEGVNYRSKLYEIDLRGATDVLHRDSVATGPAYGAVSKRLLYDFGALGQPQQNFEAMSWGPRLATGECTLVVASDDNFDQREVTQFLAYALRGC